MKYELYTDGSYDKETGTCGWGWVLAKDGVVVKQDSGTEVPPGAEEAWNIAGELTAILRGLEAASTVNSLVTVFTDLEGAQKWADGEWKAKKPITKHYVDMVKSMRAEGLVIRFIHIPGHSGNGSNELAHELAYEAACGQVPEVGTVGQPEPPPASQEPLTVAQLIRNLSEFPPDSQVNAMSSDPNMYYPVVGAEDLNAAGPYLVLGKGVLEAEPIGAEWMRGK